MKKVESGNLDKFFKSNPKKNGWFFAAFIDPESPFHNHDFEVKWSLHKKGDNKKTNPITDAKTITILLEGEFLISLPELKKEFPLKKIGDFVYFSENILHTWKCKKKARMLTIRWPSKIR